MIALFHIILGIITPHIGTIVAGISSWLKSRASLNLAKSKSEIQLKDDEAKYNKDEYDEAHEHPIWTDGLVASVKAVVVLSILGMFVYMELWGSGLTTDWLQGLVAFVIARTLSAGTIPLNRIK